MIQYPAKALRRKEEMAGMAGLRLVCLATDEEEINHESHE